MGIESDHLVFDYLSRVGDLAQQRQLPSRDRMRLVAELRGEIERHRAKAAGADSPATVRRILTRLGTPDEVVTAAGTPPPAGTDPDPAAGPQQPYAAPPRDTPPAPPAGTAPQPAATDPGPPDVGATGPDAPDVGATDPGTTPPAEPAPAAPWAPLAPLAKALRRKVPRPRSGSGTESGFGTGTESGTASGTRSAHGGAGAASRPQAGEPPAADVPSPPHLASTGELGSPDAQPDWWRTDPAPLGGTDLAPGFTGGIEIPEMLRPPARKKDTGGPDGTDRADGTDGTGGATDGTGGADGRAAGGTGSAGAGATAAGTTGAAGPSARRRSLLGPFGRRPEPGGPAGAPAPAKKARRSWTNPLLLLAAVLLVAGAVLGSWLALAFGWAIAYGSRRLTVNESKWAVLGLPGLVAAIGIGWLWGRQTGRWGEPIAQGHMSDAIAGTWPWVLRGAALASAAFLVWRSQRRRS